MYSLEKHLVEDFILNLSASPFSDGNSTKFIKEFNYTRGRTDLVILTATNHVIAIEAKLSRWRDALHQAYRNTCFAHYSYILVPENVANLAESHSLEFDKRSVGLASISDGTIQIRHQAIWNQPLQKWLNDLAIQKIMGSTQNEQFH